LIAADLLKRITATHLEEQMKQLAQVVSVFKLDQSMPTPFRH
jgi:hypothetical protein